jgi:hypothetical protein
LNPLQRFLNNQKTFYSEKIAQADMIKISDILAAVREKQPQERIRAMIWQYASNMSWIYLRLLVANIEGEIIKIVKEEREHEKYDQTRLFEHWILPCPGPIQPRVDNAKDQDCQPDLPEQAARQAGQD